jgi:hypothetical protein
VRGGVAVALLAAAAALPARSSPKTETSVFGNAPYDAPPAARGRIRIHFDFSAADQILEAVSSAKFDPVAAGQLQANSAIAAAIQSSGKPAAEFAHDLEGTFEADSRPQTFDLRSIRIDRNRWKIAVEGLKLEAEKLAVRSGDRAETLLPADVPFELTSEIEITFALPGLEDHLVLRDGERRLRVVVDLARAITLSSEGIAAERADSLSRLAAGETFRAAWDLYRKSTEAWQKPNPGNPVDVLSRAVCSVGPVALFAFDRNFFPLGVWLREPMIRALDAFNQEGRALLDPKTELDKRAELISSLRRGGLRPDPALSAGAFLADGVYQNLGADGLRKALAGGPQGLLEAYNAVAGKKSGLPPFAEPIQKQLAKH